MSKALWLATGNRHKINEFKLLLSALPLELHSQSELAVFSPPNETESTFEGNARLKARALKAVQTGVWIMADDSGLECEGLQGLPGVHSARYAGPRASDSENNAKLLKMLQIRAAPRKARFRAVLVVYSPQGEEFVFHGEMAGSIAGAPKGLHGFGYDSVFVPEGETQTLAELASAFKVKHSHRAQAARQMVTALAPLIAASKEI